MDSKKYTSGASKYYNIYVYTKLLYMDSECLNKNNIVGMNKVL